MSVISSPRLLFSRPPHSSPSLSPNGALPSSPEWALQSWEDDLTGSEDSEAGNHMQQQQPLTLKDAGMGMDLAVFEETDLVDSKLGPEVLSLFAQGSSTEGTA